LDSLLRQEFDDWVCELHNDDPGDPYPHALVREVGDPRVTVVDHEVNLGPIRTFNLAFREVSEPFVSILEDDNWWDPNFLAVMLDLMRTYPHVPLAWANMRVWREGEDGSWIDTGKTFWDRAPGSSPELYTFPHVMQLGGALHSNGAMVVRTGGLERFRVPEETTLAAIEPVRERALSSPMLLMPQPLANFSVTRTSSQSKDESAWIYARAGLAGSFLKHVPMRPEVARQLWRRARTNAPRDTNDLLLASLFFPGARFALRYATLSDVAMLTASFIHHPRRSARLLRRIGREREVWNFLDSMTQRSVREATDSGFVELTLPMLNTS
jgi:glycosyltransferase involved in cell wall biosynthesis